MKLHVDFNALLRAVNTMGAKERILSLNSTLPDLEEIDVQLKQGISVDINEIKVLDNSLLSYKGRQVLLYIQDHSWNIMAAINDGAQGKKYHVSNCSTLTNMRLQGRYDRYVATNDIDGFFLIDGINQDTGKLIEGKTELKVCQNCLKHLNYKKYKGSSSLMQVFNTFSLEEFFTTYQSYFKYQPKYKAGEINSTYTDDWSDTSNKYKDSVQWTCEDCKIQLKDNRALLHTHHINGVKQDNFTSNLKALCCECHAKQSNHAHMKISSEQKHQLRKIQEDQTFRINC